MKDIFIRLNGDRFITRTAFLYTRNGLYLERSGFIRSDDWRSYSTTDPVAIVRLAALDDRREMRMTAEALAVVEAARDSIPAELQHVELRATTSEVEMVEKAAAKIAAKAAKEAAQAAKQAEREAHALLQLVDATEDMIDAAYQACVILADYDNDRAQMLNRQGFGKVHVKTGHRIAALRGARGTQLDDGFALKLARHYRKQLPKAIQIAIGEMMS